MISVEAWRINIGRFHGMKLKCYSCKSKAKHWTSSNNVLCTVFSISLITALLLIAGVEPNPGPTLGTKNKLLIARQHTHIHILVSNQKIS